MNIPTLTREQYINLSGPDAGYLTPTMQSYHDQLNQQLQFSFSNSGLVVPALNTKTINYVSNPNTDNNKPNGTVFHNEETGKLQVKLNGQVKTIQTD